MTYMDLVKSDSSFLIHGSKMGEKSNVNFMAIDLSAMQQIADGEYTDLKKKYDELVSG